MDESLGARLRRVREQRRLTIAEASEATRVRPHYLQALESDDLSALPSTAQARGFLRIYAEFLGLGADDLLPPTPSLEATSPSISEGAAANMTLEENRATQRGMLGRLRARVLRRPRPGPLPEQNDATVTPPSSIPVPSEATQPETKKKAGS